MFTHPAMQSSQMSGDTAMSNHPAFPLAGHPLSGVTQAPLVQPAARPNNIADLPAPPIPSRHYALMLNCDPTIEPKVDSTQVPNLRAGGVLLRILATPIPAYTKLAFDTRGRIDTCNETIIIPGSSAIARVVRVGNDATSLQINQLIFFDPLLRARDSPERVRFASLVYHGLSTSCFNSLECSGYADGSYAQYMRAPLENCYLLDEARLLGDPKDGGLKYMTYQLCEIARLLRPFGGLNSIGVKPGETVLVTPATTSNGGAACMIALAMGARVIAGSFDQQELPYLETILSHTANGINGRIRTIKWTGNPDFDLQAMREFGPIDAFFDISPPGAHKSSHLRTGIMSLKLGGRVSLMGSYQELTIPNAFITRNDITLKGNWMYERKDVLAIIKMVENGNLELYDENGCFSIRRFRLKNWENALEMASSQTTLGESTVFIF